MPSDVCLLGRCGLLLLRFQSSSLGLPSNVVTSTRYICLDLKIVWGGRLEISSVTEGKRPTLANFI